MRTDDALYKKFTEEKNRLLEEESNLRVSYFGANRSLTYGNEEKNALIVKFDKTYEGVTDILYKENRYDKGAGEEASLDKLPDEFKDVYTKYEKYVKDHGKTTAVEDRDREDIEAEEEEEEEMER